MLLISSTSNDHVKLMTWWFMIIQIAHGNKLNVMNKLLWKKHTISKNNFCHIEIFGGDGILEIDINSFKILEVHIQFYFLFHNVRKDLNQP